MPPAMKLTVRQAVAQSGLMPIDAQVLLAHALGSDRAWLAAHATDALPRDRVDAFFALARRRRDGEPVAYLTGTREFWGMVLTVTPNVLIPRPETETLVERALARLPADRALRLLDLGTGSGAIALALARERPLARVIATDVSEAALIVARTNARRLYLHNVEFLPVDWYVGLPDDAPFDMIVSNPPYIAAGDRHLSQGDVRFEPMAALVSGSDGLDALRIIVAGARDRLAPGGFLLVEHGHDQAQSVREMFAGAGFADLESSRDLAGIARVMAGRRV
jgi:release factor glutamine methyltransferase